MTNKFVLFISICLLGLSQQTMAQNTKNEKNAFDLSVSIGTSIVNTGSTNLALEYGAKQQTLANAAVQLGYFDASDASTTGFIFRGQAANNASFLDKHNKENSLNNLMYLLGVFHKRKMDIKLLDGFALVSQAGAGYSWLHRLENNYVVATDEWSDNSKYFHGLALDLGCGIQYKINQKHYVELGLNLLNTFYFKKINSYQESKYSTFLFGSVEFRYGIQL